MHHLCDGWLGILGDLSKSAERDLIMGINHFQVIDLLHRDIRELTGREDTTRTFIFQSDQGIKDLKKMFFLGRHGSVLVS